MQRASSESVPVLGIRGRLLHALLTVLPRNAVSRLAGRLAELRLPGPMQRAELRLFARAVGIDLAEAADPLEAYPSLQSFFVRRLRAGARPVATDPAALVAPCDGAWGEAGRIEEGRLLQVKGRSYRVADLLGDPVEAARLEGGCFATFYLSPRDYHRFHTPTAGTIRRVDYWPGSLWPVNAVGLAAVDGLFARNERICAYLQPDPGDGARASRSVDAPPSGALVLIAVGATMVGSVRLSFCDLCTNRRGAEPERRDLDAAPPHFARAAEWGHFRFGSTIVMLVPPGGGWLEARPPGTPLRLGERIGRRSGAPPEVETQHGSGPESAG